MIECPDCLHEHMGERCGMSFLERIGSVQISSAVQAMNGHAKNYYDRASVEANFGNKQEQEKVFDETNGIGALRWSKGEPYKFSRKDGKYERASASEVDFLAAGDSRPQKAKSTTSFAQKGKSSGSGSSGGSSKKYTDKVA